MNLTNRLRRHGAQTLRLASRRPVAAELRGVRKAFGPLVALSDLTITVGVGEIVALLGQNGAGKSTAFGILLGLLPPDQGSVFLFGSRPDTAARARVGCQLQDTSLYHLIRVEEALHLFGSYYARRKAPQTLLEAFGLVHRRRSIVQRLSGGERQRLALALAFVNDPDLVVLDEPTNALDLASRQALWELLREFRREGRSVLLATHSLEEAEALADRVIILHRGRAVASGPPPELVVRYAGAERVEFALTADGRSRGAMLAELSERFSVEARCGMTTISGAPRDELLRVVLDATARHGIDLSEFRVRSGSLEEVFLSLTGEALQV